MGAEQAAGATTATSLPRDSWARGRTKAISLSSLLRAAAQPGHRPDSFGPFVRPAHVGTAARE